MSDSDKEHWKIVELPTHSSPDKPGNLVVAEFDQVTGGQFETARRLYFSTNDTDRPETRGGHRYPEGGKQILMVVVRGKVTFDFHHRDGCGQVTVDRPDRAVLIDHDVWFRAIVHPHSQILAVVSTNYVPGEGLTERLCGCQD